MVINLPKICSRKDVINMPSYLYNQIGDITPVDVIRTSTGALKVIRCCDIALFKLGLARDPYDC